MWGTLMPPIKNQTSPRLAKILARDQVGFKKRRILLYRCESDDNTWFWELSNDLDEEPVYLWFLPLQPE